MNCPVCNRQLAPTLSICLTCGTMMNDSAREELISNGNLRSRHSGYLAEQMLMPEVELATITAAVSVISEPPRPVLPQKPQARPVRTETMEFESKKTSQTLKDFQNKNASMPDWRIQLQNSVRQRKNPDEAKQNDGITAIKKKTVTSGANALKAEFIEETIEIKHEDPRVANALKRIEESRRTFLKSKETKTKAAAPRSAKPNYPFNVVQRSSNSAQRSTTPPTPERPVENRTERSAESKPRRVSSLRIEKKGFDTNKLPKIPEPVEIVSSFEKPQLIESANISEAKIYLDSEPKLDEATMKELDDLHFSMHAEANSASDNEESDDLATVSMRFGAGVFDVIIAGFAALILLSPLAFSSQGMFTFGGFLAFVGVFSLVMFLYSTATLSRFGRTLGMKLFGIELIDVAENVYPTLQQSAVNSSVYLASMLFAGIGFAPMIVNREKRALHDLISGTIVVREL